MSSVASLPTSTKPAPTNSPPPPTPMCSALMMFFTPSTRCPRLSAPKATAGSTAFLKWDPPQVPARTSSPPVPTKNLLPPTVFGRLSLPRIRAVANSKSSSPTWTSSRARAFPSLAFNPLFQLRSCASPAPATSLMNTLCSFHPSSTVLALRTALF